MSKTIPIPEGYELLSGRGRENAKAAIATAHAAGVQVRMITGDHAVTAAAIANNLGIEGRAITGAQFAELGDEQADREIDEVGVIARVTPEQKRALAMALARRLYDAAVARGVGIAVELVAG